MSKRPHCRHCDYPLSACLCAAIHPMSCRTRLVVLQHPSEVKHAKNSVRLLSRVLPLAEVVVGETPQDFAGIRQKLQGQSEVVLLYPSVQSQALKETLTREEDSGGGLTLVLIDGTWKKALKIVSLNPWLTQFPHAHLNEGYQGRYLIRKSSRSDSLSTLEAAAYALSEMEPELDVAPLFDAFDAMVNRQIAAMPKAVQRRYQVR